MKTCGVTPPLLRPVDIVRISSDLLSKNINNGMLIE
jgi:hypothetical protein